MTLKSLRLLALPLLMSVFQLFAQSTPGSWMAIPTFGFAYTNVIETPSRTFALAGGSLIAVSDDETVYFSRQNKLSDSDIEKIQYNFQKGYLLIGYSNGNIDLLYDDDHVVNMPEIKDALLTTSHQLGNIDFGNDHIAIATQFGFVLYNDRRHEVVESGIFNTPVQNVFIMGDRLVLYEKSGDVLRISPLNARHPRIDSFETMLDASGNELKVWDNLAKFDDNTILRRTPSPNAIYRYTLGEGNKLASSGWLYSNMSADSKTISYGDKCMVFSGRTTQYTVNSDLSVTASTIPSAYAGTMSFSTVGPSSVWSVSGKGLARINAESNTVLMDWYKPSASPVARVAELRWTDDGQYLYLNHVGVGLVIPNSTVSQQTARIDRNGNIQNLSFNATSVHRISLDPDDDDLYYLGAGYSGFSVYSTEGLVHLITPAQAPFAANSAVSAAPGAEVDPEGNLWVVSYADPGQRPLSVITNERRLQREWSSINMSDWRVHPAFFTDRYAHWDTFLRFNHKKPYAILTNCTYDGGYLVINLNGTYLDFSDDTFVDHIGLTDQSGASPGGSNGISCVTEDKNGAFWIGCDAGVMVIDDIAEAMNPDFKLKRPLVARNDGTVYGDYLLATEKIYGIAVDHTNRKWIATETSGVYLVSPDGSEIIEHFTTDNSPLPSNCIYSISVDPLGSTVYMGTDYGLYAYNGTSAPAADDYSDVYVYPNPVRPEYTGNVVISGLMDGSLVKIADAAGNVVFTTTSEGGCALWDVCSADGNRVRSGVYFILASQSQNGNSGVVAKIMVIN